MRHGLGYLALAAMGLVLGCASTSDSEPASSAPAFMPVDTNDLVRVAENHAELNYNGTDYVLDSYIVLFEQPYYITVTRKDVATMPLDEAVEVAVDYIKPRGCTEPLERRPDLDRHNPDKTQWLIGVAC